MAPRISAKSRFWSLVALLIRFASNFSVTDALAQSLCSPQNTGADSQPGEAPVESLINAPANGRLHP